MKEASQTDSVYDFNVRTEKKYVEKLNYIHFKPGEARIGRISRALEQLSALLVGEEGPVKVGA